MYKSVKIAVKIAFISKKKYENLAVAVHVLQNTQNLVISRSCLEEDGKEMYKDFYARAALLFCS